MLSLSPLFSGMCWSSMGLQFVRTCIIALGSRDRSSVTDCAVNEETIIFLPTQPWFPHPTLVHRISSIASLVDHSYLDKPVVVGRSSYLKSRCGSGFCRRHPTDASERHDSPTKGPRVRLCHSFIHSFLCRTEDHFVK